MAGRWGFDVQNAQTLSYQDTFGHLYNSIDFTGCTIGADLSTASTGGFAPGGITDLSQVVGGFDPVKIGSSKDLVSVTADRGANQRSGFLFDIPEVLTSPSFRATVSLGPWFERTGIVTGNSITLVANTGDGSGYGIQVKSTSIIGENVDGWIEGSSTLSIFRLDNSRQTIINNLTVPTLFESAPGSGIEFQIFSILNSLSLSFDGINKWSFYVAGSEVGSLFNSLFSTTEYNNLSITDSTYSRSDIVAITCIIDTPNSTWIPSVSWMALTDNAHPIVDNNYSSLFFSGTSPTINSYTDLYYFSSDQFGVDPISYTEQAIIGLDTSYLRSVPTATNSFGLQDPVEILDLSTINEFIGASYSPLSIGIKLNSDGTSSNYLGSVNDATPQSYSFVFTSGNGVNLDGTSIDDDVPSSFKIKTNIDEIGSGWKFFNGVGMSNISYGILCFVDEDIAAIIEYDESVMGSFVSTLSLDDIAPEKILAQGAHSFTGNGVISFEYDNEAGWTGFRIGILNNDDATPVNVTICESPRLPIVSHGAISIGLFNATLNSVSVTGTIKQVNENISSISSFINPSETIMSMAPFTVPKLTNITKSASELAFILKKNPFIDKVTILENLDSDTNRFELVDLGSFLGSPTHTLSSYLNFSEELDGSMILNTNGNGSLDPRPITDYHSVSPSLYQSAQIVDGLFKPVSGQSSHRSSIFFSAVDNPNYYGPITTGGKARFSVAFGGFSGSVESNPTDDSHIEIYLGNDELSGSGYYLNARVLNIPGSTDKFTRFNLGIFSPSEKYIINTVDIPYTLSVGDILSLSVELVDNDGDFSNSVSVEFNHFTIDNFQHNSNNGINNDYLTLNNLGVELRAESDTDWIPSVGWMSLSGGLDNEFFDKDILGYYRYLFYYNFIANQISNIVSSPFIYGPNVEIASTDLGYDQEYVDPINPTNTFIADSRIMEFISNFLDDTNQYGLAFIVSDYSDSELTALINYAKENLDPRLMIHLKSRQDPPSIIYPVNANKFLNQSDVVIWPSDVIFTSDTVSIVKGNWIFSGNISSNSDINNAYIKISVLGNSLIKSGTLPFITVYDEDDNIVHDETVYAGKIVNLGTLSAGSYTYKVSGFAGSSGNALIKLVFDADNIDPISVDDTIVVIKES